jgi:hypothetical protein
MIAQFVSRRTVVILCATVSWLGGSTRASGESAPLGAESCQKCHESEYRVWEQTKHAASFREVHKLPKAKEILAAVGGATSMKKHETCARCHYTMTLDPETSELAAASGPSCESCHGAAADWIAIHNDYGGAGVTRETESAEHKAKRIKSARAAGMRWPSMTYELASNCTACHALAQPELDAATIGKMLDAGHPLKPEWELIRYSQGTVRHRFYPPDITVNREMTPAELARNFVIGAAAKLVSAKAALGKSKHAAYQTAQQQRMSDATAVLSAVQGIPEAAALLAAPTEQNALKLMAAIADKDLSGDVGHLVPDRSTYK